MKLRAIMSHLNHLIRLLFTFKTRFDHLIWKSAGIKLKISALQSDTNVSAPPTHQTKRKENYQIGSLSLSLYKIVNRVKDRWTQSHKTNFPFPLRSHSSLGLSQNRVGTDGNCFNTHDLRWMRSWQWLHVKHTMRGDTCPTEWYMSNRSFREFARELNKFWLVKLIFWIQGPAAADTSHSGTIFDQSDARRHPVSWILNGQKSFHCAMYLLPLDLVSKNQLSTNQNLFNARAISRNDRWTCIIPLDMYRIV